MTRRYPLLAAATLLAVGAGGSANAIAKPATERSTDLVDRHFAKATLVEDSLQQQAQEQTETRTTEDGAYQTTAIDQRIDQKDDSDCRSHCIGGTLTQTATQDATTVQTLDQSQTDGTTQTLTASQSASTQQRIKQKQMGCMAWCWDQILVQTAIQQESTTQSVSQEQIGGTVQTAEATQTATTEQWIKQVQLDCVAKCTNTSAIQTSLQTSTGDSTLVQEQQGTAGATQTQIAVISDAVTQTTDQEQSGGDAQTQSATAATDGSSSIAQLQQADGTAVQTQDAATVTAVDQHVAQEQGGSATTQLQDGAVSVGSDQAIVQDAVQGTGELTTGSIATSTSTALNARDVDQVLAQTQESDAPVVEQDQGATLTDAGVQSVASAAGTDEVGTSATTVVAQATAANVSAVTQDAAQTQYADGSTAGQSQQVTFSADQDQTAVAEADAVQRFATNALDLTGAGVGDVDQKIVAEAAASAGNLATVSQSGVQDQTGTGSGTQVQDSTQDVERDQVATASPFALQVAPTNTVVLVDPADVGHITQTSVVKATGEAVNAGSTLQDGTQSQSGAAVQDQQLDQTADSTQAAATTLSEHNLREVSAVQEGASNVVVIVRGEGADGSTGTITQANVVEASGTTANVDVLAQGGGQIQAYGDDQQQAVSQSGTSDAIAGATAFALQDELFGAGASNIVTSTRQDGATGTDGAVAQSNSSTATAGAYGADRFAQDAVQRQDTDGAQAADQDAVRSSSGSAIPVAFQVFPTNVAANDDPATGGVAGSQHNTAATLADADVSVYGDQDVRQAQRGAGRQSSEQQSTVSASSLVTPTTLQDIPQNLVGQATVTGTNVAGTQVNQATADGRSTAAAGSTQKARQTGGSQSAVQDVTSIATAEGSALSGQNLPVNAVAQVTDSGANVGGEQVNRNGAKSVTHATATTTQDAVGRGKGSQTTEQRAQTAASGTSTAVAFQLGDGDENVSLQESGSGANVAGSQLNANGAVAAAHGNAETDQHSRQRGGDDRNVRQEATTTGSGTATTETTSAGMTNFVEQRTATGTNTGGRQTTANAARSVAVGTAKTTQDAKQSGWKRTGARAAEQTATTTGQATATATGIVGGAANHELQSDDGGSSRSGKATIVNAVDAKAVAKATTKQRGKVTERRDDTREPADAVAMPISEGEQQVRTAPVKPTLKLVGLTSSDPVAKRKDAETVKRALEQLDERDAAAGRRR